MRVKVTLSYEYNVVPSDYDVVDYNDQDALLDAVREIDLEPNNVIEAIDYIFSNGTPFTVSVERVEQ